MATDSAPGCRSPGESAAPGLRPVPASPAPGARDAGQRHGPAVRRCPPPPTPPLPPTRLRVAALLAAGMSVREIAEEIGVAKSAVQRMKPKLERRPAPRLP